MEFTIFTFYKGQLAFITIGVFLDTRGHLVILSLGHNLVES